MLRFFGVFGVSILVLENTFNYFSENPKSLGETISSVKSGFQNPSFDDKDIMDHIYDPEIVALVHSNSLDAVVGFAGYTRLTFDSVPVLSIEGIALHKDFQKKGLFAKLTDAVASKEEAFCLRTQNPHMFKALENYVCELYPSSNLSSNSAKKIGYSYAAEKNCVMNDSYIVKGCYPFQLYGESFTDSEGIFSKLDYSKGDALIGVGFK